MLKKNKWKIIISSLLTLLPMILGVFSLEILPQNIRIDTLSTFSPVFFIFPAIMLTVHLLCIFISALIDKNMEKNKKMQEIVFLIIPFISLATSAVMVAIAFGYESKISIFSAIMIAIPFMIIGNYLPKTTRNITMGIRTKRTLSSDENWAATHRFGGKVFVVAGFLCLFGVLLPIVAFFCFILALSLVSCIVVTVYSYRFYKKQLKEGKLSKEDIASAKYEPVKNKKLAIIITVALLLIMAVSFPIIMFTGKIETTLEETQITVKASLSGELSIKYEDIDSVEYRPDGVDGTRVFGVGSAKILTGTFKNEEFGNYTRYTYTGKNPCVVIKANGSVFVIGGENEQAVKQTYDGILEKISD